MSTVPPTIQNLARRMLAYEAAQPDSTSSPGDETVRVCEKLRATLSRLMGEVGFRALLSRALALAKADDPILKSVKVRENGSLEGFETVAQERDREAGQYVGAALVVQILWLLATFIGEPLTLRLVDDTWPELPMDGLGPKAEEKRI